MEASFPAFAWASQPPSDSIVVGLSCNVDFDQGRVSQATQSMSAGLFGVASARQGSVGDENALLVVFSPDETLAACRPAHGDDSGGS